MTQIPRQAPPMEPWAPPVYGDYLPAVPPPPPRRRFPWGRALGIVVVVALLAVVAIQAYALSRVNQRLDGAYGRMTEVDRAGQERAETLESRVAELETALGRQFNPEAIATAVLPSVFRVGAGQLTGTAFAVGKNTGAGGTNLFTNYHVVKQVFEGGGREVTLERQDKKLTARIVAVDPDIDVAHLRTTAGVKGLTDAKTPVKAGQQIVVVGSPLGLDETVTTGVVSAFRKLDDESGTVIQFDAPINPGNSGGPVVNADKQVVGIASAKARDAEGIGLAVPIDTACSTFKVC
jgi:putative serine protease PepD